MTELDQRIEILKKNYEERMDEFLGVLGGMEFLPGCKVLDQWRHHLDLTMSNRTGWIAVYKPPKDKLQSTGPDFIDEIVLVKELLHHTFEALVIGNEQQKADDNCDNNSEISTLSTKLVKLQIEHLYPCIQQQNFSCIEGIEINNIIDKFRFFKQRLWLPWDEENEEDDWRVSALEPRMQLLYDMEQGQISCEISDRIKRLHKQAWKNHETLRKFEEAVEVGDDSSVIILEGQDDEDEEIAIKIMKLNHRLEFMQKEYERLHNPLIRNLMIREKQRAIKKNLKKIDKPWLRLIWPGGKCQELMQYIKDISEKSLQKEDNLKIYPLLQMALEDSVCNDKIYLTPGIYTLNGSGGLEKGGTMEGLGKVYISGIESGDVMMTLECDINEKSGDEEIQDITPSFILRNIYLDARGLEICLLINSGHILLDNCKLDGKGSIDDSVGCMIRSGSKFTARNCTFSGFSTAIIAYDNSQLEFDNCVIENCETGLQIFRGAKIEMKDSKVVACSKIGFMCKWDTRNNNSNNLNELSHEILNSLPGFNISSTNLDAVQVVVQGNQGDGENIRFDENVDSASEINLLSTSICL